MENYSIFIYLVSIFAACFSVLVVLLLTIKYFPISIRIKLSELKYNEKLYTAILGLALFISGLCFLYQYNKNGKISYFFKVPMVVSDSLGAYLLSCGLILFGVILFLYNITIFLIKNLR
jgi:hypothetical protein